MTSAALLYATLPALVTLQLLLLGKLVTTLPTAPFLFVAQISGLLGATFMAQNIVLTSRLPFLDDLFGGLDKATKLHRTMGMLAFVTLVQHAVFLILNRYPTFDSALMYLVPAANNIPYAAGIAGLGLMILLVILTLFVDLPYHIWKKTHEWFMWVVLLGAYHGFTVSSDISRFLPLRIWMMGIIGFAVLAMLYRKYLYRFIGPRWQYFVDKTIRRGDILELYLVARNKPMLYYPGQFAFLVVDDKKIGNEEHPFSISSTPGDPYLRFSIKIAGDYTLLLTGLTEGTVVSVWGPYGRFGEKLFSKKQILMIAGGIGVTPFLSMIRATLGALSDSKISLYYTTPTRQEAVYDAEIKELTSRSAAFSYTLHCSKEEGRLNAEKIQLGTGSLSDCLVFLCGPPPMMASMTDQLIQKGVRRKNIIFEDFSFA